MKLFTRHELSVIVASEETNGCIGYKHYDRMNSILYNYLMNCEESEFIARFERDKRFKLTRVIKNRYFF